MGITDQIFGMPYTPKRKPPQASGRATGTEDLSITYGDISGAESAVGKAWTNVAGDTTFKKLRPSGRLSPNARRVLEGSGPADLTISAPMPKMKPTHKRK